MKNYDKITREHFTRQETRIALKISVSVLCNNSKTEKVKI